MTIPSPRLGIYQRTIGEKLSSTPMTAEDAYNILRYTDVGYASATLIRLRDKGIAEEIEQGKFIRGPRWNEAAEYYQWGTGEARTPVDLRSTPTSVFSLNKGNDNDQ